MNSLKTVKEVGDPLTLVANFSYAGNVGLPDVVSLPSPVTAYEAEVEIEYLPGMFYPFFEIRGCPYEGN